MNPRIKNIANRVREAKANGQKFVLLLGAGASMKSGVKRTPEIMEELVAKFGNDLTGKLEDKFYTIWKGMTPDDRDTFLKPLLAHRPSAGYGKLAALIDEEYFDVALTFNFDNLLEKSLGAIDCEFKPVIRGEVVDDGMQTLLDQEEPRFKVVKLHGSVNSTERFFFDIREMFEYPPLIHALFEKLTSNPLIICGYAFNDLCVVRSFSRSGGPIVCVNPAGVPTNLQGFVSNRDSDGLSIDLGFDDFFEQLYKELVAPKAPPKLLPNPFKFLESYEEEEKDTFFERDEPISNFGKAITTAPDRIIVVAGPAKAGKTSLVRAGLMPSLQTDTYVSVYVRCHDDLNASLPRALWPDKDLPGDVTVASALKRLGTISDTKRVILFLDQFERAAPADENALATFVNTQLVNDRDNVTLVLVVVDNPPTVVQTLYPTLANQNLLHIVRCPAFERGDVSKIIQSLAKRAEFPIHPDIAEDILTRYESGKNSTAPDRFTLAHVQALCHVLTAARTNDFDRYRRELDNTLRALNHAINACDFVSFVEDLSWSEAAWFRNMIKVPLRESKATIAEFITSHWKELVPPSGARTLRSTLDERNAGKVV